MAKRYAKDQPQGFVNQIKNVAIIGAGGQMGSPITAALLKTGQHTITAITRPDSTSTFPEGVKTAKASYDDHAALVNAMRGQDALVITMNVLAPKDSVTKLVEAGLEAGVPWILPNEWGSDYTNRAINEGVMLGNDKLAIRNLIETKGGTKSSWIAVACGFWYDYSLAGGVWTFGFDFSKKELTYYDDGNTKLYYSTLPYAGQGVAKLLSLPVLPEGPEDNNNSPCLEDYRNAICRFQCFHLNQKDMLASVLRVTGDKESDWTIKSATSESRYHDAKKLFQTGDLRGYRLMLYSRLFYPSNEQKKLEDYSDQRLGLEPPVLDDVTKGALDLIGKRPA